MKNNYLFIPIALFILALAMLVGYNANGQVSSFKIIQIDSYDGDLLVDREKTNREEKVKAPICYKLIKKNALPLEK